MGPPAQLRALAHEIVRRALGVARERQPPSTQHGSARRERRVGLPQQPRVEDELEAMRRCDRVHIAHREQLGAELEQIARGRSSGGSQRRERLAVPGSSRDGLGHGGPPRRATTLG